MKKITLTNDITVDLKEISRIKLFRGFSVRINDKHYLADFNTGAIPSKYNAELCYNLGFSIENYSNVAEYLISKLSYEKNFTQNELEAFQELVTPLTPVIQRNGEYYDFRPYMTKLKGHNLWVLNKNKILEKEMEFLRGISYIDLNDLLP